MHGVIKRLDPETVTSREQQAIAFVPDGEGELAAQRVHGASAAILVEVQRDLAVRSAAKGVALSRQRIAGFLEVVELAVDDQPEPAVFVGDRLIPGLKIDDAESRVAESGTPLRRNPDALCIRTAVAETPRGTTQCLVGETASFRDRRDDATHVTSPRDGTGCRRSRRHSTLRSRRGYSSGDRPWRSCSPSP